MSKVKVSKEETRKAELKKEGKSMDPKGAACIVAEPREIVFVIKFL